MNKTNSYLIECYILHETSPLLSDSRFKLKLQHGDRILILTAPAQAGDRSIDSWPDSWWNKP